MPVKPKRISMSALEARMDSNDGYCASCRKFTNDGGTEPDARRYPCERCGKPTVYGAEEAVFMGLLTVAGGD